MNINSINTISFKGQHRQQGIVVQNGGMNYIMQEGGESAVARLNLAKEQFSNSQWQLGINENGYSLTSPSTRKTYTGPFSVKKLLKTGAKREHTTSLVVRMDKNNRTKFSVQLPAMSDVSKLYKAIKNSNGLEKMLLILSVLEKHI